MPVRQCLLVYLEMRAFCAGSRVFTRAPKTILPFSRESKLPACHPEEQQTSVEPELEKNGRFHFWIPPHVCVRSTQNTVEHIYKWKVRVEFQQHAPRFLRDEWMSQGTTSRSRVQCMIGEFCSRKVKVIRGFQTRM